MGLRFLAIGSVLALAGCPEERAPFHAGNGGGSSECGVTDLPEHPVFSFEGVDEVIYVNCARPGGAGGPDLDEITFPESIVSGIPLEVEIQVPEDLDSPVYLVFWYTVPMAVATGDFDPTRISRPRGYYIARIDDPTSPLLVSMTVKESAKGQYTLAYALDDGTGAPEAPHIGRVHTQPLYVIPVGTGDVQVNLHWNTKTDVDLHVIDPDGDEIYYANASVPSGGMLDLDSYAACNFEGDRGRGNENVFWASDSAPSGRYQVLVHMYADCGTYAAGTETEWRITAVLDRTEVMTQTGTFTAASEQYVEVLDFTF